MLYLVLAMLLVGFVASGLIFLSAPSKVDGVPRDLRRAGDDEPRTQGGAFGRTAWMMHGPS
ncbi:hypothetical protein OHA72_33090 [Dactylosporangium sp. NBC_01737]|uniref:hypothetical protein n=1 Tax=Dactylosporangium sp. NBC_01737 TaxID=2975959 RepID=UPI002E14578F|nr:hypothetical protein OHA72_33090 [Dactylosporangium sp. NBC_01737]